MQCFWFGFNFWFLFCFGLVFFLSFCLCFCLCFGLGLGFGFGFFFFGFGFGFGFCLDLGLSSILYSWLGWGGRVGLNLKLIIKKKFATIPLVQAHDQVGVWVGLVLMNHNK